MEFIVRTLSKTCMDSTYLAKEYFKGNEDTYKRGQVVLCTIVQEAEYK